MLPWAASASVNGLVINGMGGKITLSHGEPNSVVDLVDGAVRANQRRRIGGEYARSESDLFGKRIGHKVPAVELAVFAVHHRGLAHQIDGRAVDAPFLDA